jgi:hypothetical protein
MPALENQPNPITKISKVLRKLEIYNPPVKPQEKIIAMVDLFSHGSEKNNQTQLNDAFSSYKEFGRGSLEHFQETLTAYLFNVNRQLYKEEGGKNFDPKKEKRQIEAVVAALKGEHVHMGTGEGKSLVVLPIASLVESLTSDKKDVVVATANDTLLTEIQNRTEKLAKSLPSNVVEVSKSKRQEGKDFIDDQLHKNMQKEALLNGQFSPETTSQLRINFWTDQTTPAPEQKPGLPDKISSDQSRVVFMTERNLVFSASDNKKDFQNKVPRILMDEADIPYNRRSLYQKVSESLFMTPEQIQNSTHQWLTNFMISRQLSEKDFEFASGDYQLKEGRANKLILNPKNSRSFFAEGIDLIAKKLNLNDQEKEDLSIKASTYLVENKPKSEDLKMYAEAIGNLTATVTFLKNRHYVIDKETNRALVRDAYIDELLENHRYQPEYQMAILALNNQFEIVDLHPAAHSSMTFTSFVNLCADKLVCLSGTLLYPDPLTGKTKESSFTKLLEDLTRRSVVEITPPDPKTVPRPEFFDNNTKAEEKIINDLKNNPQPTLIIDYENVAHTDSLFQKISQSFPDKKIVLLPPKPSITKLEVEYNNLVNRITRELAEGKIDLIVSSGAAGTGVNVVRADGGFPDLHVSILGMPENEMQLVQSIGRRRLQGNSFSWYVNQESIERFVSYYQSETVSKLEILLGKIDQPRIKELIEKAKNDPEKRLKVCLELLGEKRRNESQNDQTLIETDSFYDSVLSLFHNQLKEKLEKQGLSQKEKELFLNFYNAPGSLYYDLLREASLTLGTGDPKQFVQKLGQAVLNEPTLDKKYDSILSQWVNEWFETNKNRVKDFRDLITFNGEVDLEPQQVVFLPVTNPDISYEPATSFLLPGSLNEQVQPVSIKINDNQRAIGALINGQLCLVSSAETTGALGFSDKLNFSFLPSSKKPNYLVFFKNK